MASIQKAKTHCVHRWAAGSDSRGRTGNMSFIGPVGYSYATVVAVLYSEKKTCVIAGEGIHNSVSTRAHKSTFAYYARQQGYEIIEVDVPARYALAASPLETEDGVYVCHTAMDVTLSRKAQVVNRSRAEWPPPSKATRAVRYRDLLQYLERMNKIAGFIGYPSLRVEDLLSVECEWEAKNLEEHERKHQHGRVYIPPACPGPDNVL